MPRQPHYAPDRLDDYRREQIAIRKASRRLTWTEFDASDQDKAEAVDDARRILLTHKTHGNTPTPSTDRSTS